MELPSRVREGVGASFAVLAATAALAGCGGGSASTGSSASSKVATASAASTTSTAAQTGAKLDAVSRAQFVASAGAICKRANAELTAVTPKSASFAEILRIVPGRVVSERKAALELSALKPPAALSQDWRLLVAYRHTLAGELAQLVTAAEKKDTAKITALSASKLRERRLLLRTANLAGISACGRVG